MSHYDFHLQYSGKALSLSIGTQQEAFKGILGGFKQHL